MKRITTLLIISVLSIGVYAQDLELSDIVNFSTSKLKSKGFSGNGNTLTGGETTITIRSKYTGMEVSTGNKGMFDDVQAAAKKAYGKPETFHDTGVGGTITEYIIDEGEFIMFYTLTDSTTNEASYHIGYAKD